MIKVHVNRNATEQLDRIANYVDTLPNRIGQANDRAGNSVQKSIPKKYAEVARGGKYVTVTAVRYGPVGLALTLKPSGSLTKKGAGRTKRNPAWGAAIFLNGRTNYVIGPSKAKNGAFKLRRDSWGEHGKYRHAPLYIKPVKSNRQRAIEIAREEVIKALQKQYMIVGFGPQGGGSRLSDF